MFVVNLLTLLQLDAFSTPQLKKDLDKMRTDWLNTKLQMGGFHYVINDAQFIVSLGYVYGFTRVSKHKCCSKKCLGSLTEFFLN